MDEACSQITEENAISMHPYFAFYWDVWKLQCFKYKKLYVVKNVDTRDVRS